jgi:hypothetical protein
LLVLFAIVIGLFVFLTFAPEGTLKVIGLGLFVITALLAIMFVVLGEQIINQVPTVQAFRRTHEAWSSLHIAGFRVPNDCVLAEMVQWRFEELTDRSKPEAAPEGVRHIRFGNVVTFLTFRERSLRHLVRELRVYSGGFLSLMTIAFLVSGPQLAHKTLTEIADLVVSQHFIPILEASTILYLVVRLFSEVGTMRSLMNGE